ncbi:MAG: large conductance mechanosensitive channel protein MscL [Clostridia bacterium]|nr:large conductance mechanosensitive channel protein MscL [Clostridia bacterium]
MAKQKKEKKDKKGFWKEFKEFISRGNVLDMAVGIIIGGAFTAIITALVNNILTPLLQMIPGMGEDGFGALQVVLRKATATSDAVILDFGVVISAIISFLLTALVLFIIIKVINSVHNAAKKAKESAQAKMLEKQENGENAEEEVAAEAVAEEAPAEEAPAPAPTTEELLMEIRDLLKAQPEKAKAKPKKTKKEA